MGKSFVIVLLWALLSQGHARDSVSEVLDGDIYLLPRQAVKHRRSAPAPVSGTAELPPLPPEISPETPTAQILEAPRPETESAQALTESTQANQATQTAQTIQTTQTIQTITQTDQATQAIQSTQVTQSVPSPQLTPFTASSLRALSAQSLKAMGIEAKWESKDVLLITLSDYNTRFRSGEDKVRPAALNELKAVAYSLKLYDWVQWRVDGHADRRGSAASNLDLSQRRAWEVAAALVNLGMPAEKLAGAWGWSYKKPLVRGHSAEALGMNRRVELRLTKK